MGKARPRCASTGRAAFADPGFSPCLLTLSDRELPLQHVDDLPVERAGLVCCELLKSLVERERHPQGDLFEIASWAPLRTSLFGHRSTLPAHCCSIAQPDYDRTRLRIIAVTSNERVYYWAQIPGQGSALVTYL